MTAKPDNPPAPCAPSGRVVDVHGDCIWCFAWNGEICQYARIHALVRDGMQAKPPKRRRGRPTNSERAMLAERTKTDDR